MLLNTEICMAVKNSLGLYDITTISLFRISNIKFTSLIFSKTRSNEVVFKIKCPLCGEYHEYAFKISDFLKRYMTIGGCESMGIPIFYIGKENVVEQKVKKHREVNMKIQAMI